MRWQADEDMFTCTGVQLIDCDRKRNLRFVYAIRFDWIHIIVFGPFIKYILTRFQKSIYRPSWRSTSCITYNTRSRCIAISAYLSQGRIVTTSSNRTNSHPTIQIGHFCSTPSPHIRERVSSLNTSTYKQTEVVHNFYHGIDTILYYSS